MTLFLPFRSGSPYSYSVSGAAGLAQEASRGELRVVELVRSDSLWTPKLTDHRSASTPGAAVQQVDRMSAVRLYGYHQVRPII